MTAFIEGSVQTPTGRIVPMTINAKPIPDPGKLADGNVLVAGNLAAGVRAPISVALHPGRYRLRVFTPAGLLAEREMDLVDDQRVTIAELLEPTTVLASPAVDPEPRAQPPAPPVPAGPSGPIPEGWDTL
jgi:hypothetical protein|nr:MAG TPA: hypothetical protein [Caudoviricetes sp.]